MFRHFTTVLPVKQHVADTLAGQQRVDRGRELRLVDGGVGIIEPLTVLLGPSHSSLWLLHAFHMAPT